MLLQKIIFLNVVFAPETLSSEQELDLQIISFSLKTL